MIKRNYNWIIDKEQDKPDGKLRLRVKWNNNKDIVAFNIGYRVDPTKWSKETARCKNNTTHGKDKIPAAVINKKINFYEQSADKVFFEYESKEQIPSKNDFKGVFSALIGKKVESISSNDNILETFDKFVKEMGQKNDWSISTFQKFATLRVKLVAFSPIDFEAFSENGLTSFVYFLRQEYNLRNTTIAKQLGLLKWFLRWTHKNGYNKQTDFLSYSPKFKQSEKRIIFLTWDELMKVYHFPLPSHKEYLQRVRDVFCFCCFTSLRYSDVANLKRSDVYQDHIEVTTVKTSDSLKIELNNYSQAILAKYEGEQFADNLALPVVSNQKMNDYLKEVGEMCGINAPIRETYYIGNERIDEVFPKWQLLSSHAGRRTFICNALTLGIPANIVMKWTGHSDYKAMKPYIDIADKAKEDAMKLFNKG